MSKQMSFKREKENRYSQTSRLETPKELQLHHNHEKFLFLTVLLLLAQCKCESSILLSVFSSSLQSVLYGRFENL
jgi:hypothetical protein